MDRDRVFLDTLFWFASLLISITVIFLFDLQWNLSSSGWFLFTNMNLYVVGGFIGSIVGFFLIKYIITKRTSLEKNK